MEFPRTRHEMFEVLRQFLTFDGIDYEERKAVWDVLTALRGPDGSDFENIDDSDRRTNEKIATTAVIRSHLLRVEMSCFGSLVNLDSEHRASHRRTGERTSSFHFYGHAQRAFHALGLKWNENNDPTEDDR